MTLPAPAVDRPELALDLDSLIDRVTARVAPAWPLDRAIAVNPLWGFVEHPREEVLLTLGAWIGSRTSLPRAWYRDARSAGRFDAAHVREAIARLGWSLSVDEVLGALDAPEPLAPRRERVTDVVDAINGPFRDRSCAETVAHAIGQRCLATLSQPGGPSLYASWRQDAARDGGPELALGLRGLRAVFAELPGDPRRAITSGLTRLGIDESDAESYLTAVLLDVSGWAAACAYRRWDARQRGGEDDAPLELLAARLGWEVALLEVGDSRVHDAWATARAAWSEIDAQFERARRVDLAVHRAFEIAHHESLARRLAAADAAAPPDVPAFQLVCCIDVRSEPLRRAVERADPGARTLGFAGFFGLPAHYHAAGDSRGRPQLPGPLAPNVQVTDLQPDASIGDRRVDRITWESTWKRFVQDPVSAFAFVETTGLAYAPRLLTDAFGFTRPAAPVDEAGLTPVERSQLRPRLMGDRTGAPLPIDARADLAERILRGSGLGGALAPLVVLAGHAAQVVNNPHAAALDCGACCGHSGAVNARAVAALLDEPDVRAALRDRGLDLDGTWFLAALHETTTDTVAFLDEDLVPASHRAHVERARAALDAACQQTREERARRMGLDERGPALLSALRARARDWGQPRPEWGLAGNAALVIAPRARTSGLDLDGRVFLHEYRWQDDPSGAILELLLTAPMVVAHWINFQYFSSTIDPTRWGSGDKLLHDVVAGGIGVFEGDGGDLRVGLPIQSVHDGVKLAHEPIALGVFVEAPRDAIERVLNDHATIRDLVDGGWVHLHRIDARGAVEARVRGAWRAVASP